MEKEKQYAMTFIVYCLNNGYSQSLGNLEAETASKARPYCVLKRK